MSRGSAAVLSLLVLCSLAASPPPQPRRLVVEGSDAMIVLAQHFAKGFASDPAAPAVDVRASGPNAALGGLHAGTTDIAQMLRALSPKELAAVADRPLQIRVGVEAVAIIVHPGNPVSQLTVRQLKDIFLGKIANWREVGGKDARIQLYSTESAVGGSVFFREAVLDGEEFDTTMRGFANSKSMAEAVAADPNGIGFGNLSVLAQGKPLKIAAHPGSMPVEATSDNLRSGQYPVSRYLFWILPAKPSRDAQRFATWAVSRDGQLVVESLGYYPLTAADRAAAVAKLEAARDR